MRRSKRPLGSITKSAGKLQGAIAGTLEEKWEA
jgi:hypothetical protein